MTKFKSEFMHHVSERGFLHQASDLEGLDDLMSKKSVTAYIGFDATAPSLHVGSLMCIMMLAWMQRTGHKPMTLMGGGTTKVGDPSGKDEARKLLDDETIQKNIEGMQKVFGKFLNYGNGATDAVMVNNEKWLTALNYIEFLRDYGRHFSVNRMLSFDSVKLRLEREQPLSFLEFNYMIMQAYDFVELFKTQNVQLQMGGSDQWGNIINGVELGRRAHQLNLFGLTFPLITTSSGAKMGKSAAGAVWLNEDMLPVYDYYQFWRNTEDADVGRFLKYFTFLPMDEIAKLEKLQGAEINEAKKILAFEATKLCHSFEAAQKAEATAKATFEQGGMGENLPVFIVSAAQNATIFDVIIGLGFASSKGEVKRLFEGNGIKLNDEIISDSIDIKAALEQQEELKISVGKKRHGILKLG